MGQEEDTADQNKTLEEGPLRRNCGWEGTQSTETPSSRSQGVNNTLVSLPLSFYLPIFCDLLCMLPQCQAYQVQSKKMYGDARTV